ncbi:hypothetical protein, partial [Allochromatium palmeri]|uniref:hypothetical protein n=1 Tax=Allochromatium palmeri TaxID=231048 RepID=UPI001CA45C4E
MNKTFPQDSQVPCAGRWLRTGRVNLGRICSRGCNSGLRMCFKAISELMLRSRLQSPELAEGMLKRLDIELRA